MSVMKLVNPQYLCGRRYDCCQARDLQEKDALIFIEAAANRQGEVAGCDCWSSSKRKKAALVQLLFEAFDMTAASTGLSERILQRMVCLSRYSMSVVSCWLLSGCD